MWHRSTTPQQWEDFSRYNKDRADAEMASSRRLREANHHVIQQTDNDLAAQQAATDYVLRKRVHELERALDELRWQKQQVSVGLQASLHTYQLPVYNRLCDYDERQFHVHSEATEASLV